MRISDWSSDVCSSDLLVPMGGTTEEFSFDQKRNLAGRRRNRGRHLRSGISGFVIGDHCSFGRRATTDFQRCGSCILVAAQTHNQDRKSVVEGTRVSGRVDAGVRRLIENNKTIKE